jgi:hypothetical protein
LFENEWFPKAKALGISWDEFWRMNPRIIKLHIRAHEEWLKEQDYLMWIQGRYVHDAFMVGLAHFASSHSNAEYPKNPYLDNLTENGLINRTEEEQAQAAENFLLRLQIMGSNYERANKNKDSTVS